MNGAPHGVSSTRPATGFSLVVNGRVLPVHGLPPATTLLEFLRAQGVTGPKRGCDEGDCGACTVALLDRDAAGRPAYRAINSCLTLLPACAGREFVTAEGLAAARPPLHPIQSALVDHYASQCGYCTPGFVMSLFEACYDPAAPAAGRIDEQLCGNLCRCTGYRPLRDAAGDALAACRETPPAPDAFRTRLAAPVDPPAPFAYAADNGRFYRPGSLPELFALLAADPTARLVGGATEIAVELNKQAAACPGLIATEGVPELTRLIAGPAAWRIGAAVTLTHLEETLAGEYPSLAQMLHLFAARQIRSRATLGGNLATASPVGDSAPVLLTLDAELVLASAGGERTVPLAGFFAGYRRTILQPGEIIREILLPRATPALADLTRRVEFCKVARRREHDIGTVTAAFRLDLDADGFVRAARLAYGGVAPIPRRARRVEAILEGRKLSEAAAAAAALLADEFQPIDDLRGSAAYRRALVVNLWERFAAGERAPGPPESGRSPGAIWTIADASRARRHDSASGHATGAALFVDDLAQRRPMLDVWPVCAPHAHARLTRLDVSAALRAPGVVAVVTARDIPGDNNVGISRHDEPLLASEAVGFHGQMVALVVGTSIRACRAAAALVEAEYEPLPPVLTLAAAVAQGSFHTEPRVLRRGDCEAALAAAPARFDGELTIGGQEHFYLETQAAWAEPGEEGTVFLCSSTQHPADIQAIVAGVLALPQHKVVTQTPRLGGGFGGKESQGAAFAALVALAAVRTGRAVRLQLDRDLDMILTGKRHPCHARFSVGHDSDGRLLAVAVDLVTNGGWSLDLSQPILDRALFHLDNAYYLPAVRFTGRVAKTNTASNTAFRGFGAPQAMLVIEEIMDRVARRLGLPPDVVRGRNLYHGSGETNTTHYGADLGDHHLPEIWWQTFARSDFPARRVAIDSWNRTHPHCKRGLALTPVKFGISFTLTQLNQAGALVLLYPDGTAQVNHGGTEMGQGLHTKVLGIAMRELGLPAECIRLMATSTDKVPNASPTAGSASADLNGAAVAAACATLRERLAPVALRLLGAAPAAGDTPAAPADPATLAATLVFAEGRVSRREEPARSVSFAAVCRAAHQARVSLAATGFYRTPRINWDWATRQGRPFHYYVGAAAVAEVEVDGTTGQASLRRVDIVEDVGESLNPGVDRGQIEGGFMQGLGWLTNEELRWDDQGRLLTHSASTYRIPSAGDAPDIFNVTLLPAAAQPGVIHGSKAVGEPPFMLAIAAREAIRDAVAAFGPPAGEVPLPSPATPEAIYWAIQARRQAAAGPHP